jgi:hypothetical protein
MVEQALEWLRTAAGWLLLGFSLLILETLLPGAFLMWFGLAALATGVLAWLLPALSWHAEVISFALLSIGTVLGYKLYRKRHPAKQEGPQRNRRAEELLGRVFELSEPIVNGVGKIKQGDLRWTVRGPDLPLGSKVRLKSYRNMIFEVESA